jgi:N-acetylneuraminic acid mutarotase
MRRKNTARYAHVGRTLDEAGFFNLHASIAVVLCALVGCSMLSATLLGFFSPQASLKVSERTLSFAERVTYQRTIEDVYWRHRIWPNDRHDPKPPLDSVMSQAQVEKKVADYLGKSQALEDHWQRPITAEQLQVEMDRMAANTKQPEVLRELFETLGNDPFVIAECLARPVLVDGLLGKIHDDYQEPLDSRRRSAENQKRKPVAAVTGSYTLPIISTGPNGCVDDTWTATSTTSAPAGRSTHTAVWTGSEMIVWGGWNGSTFFDTGARYNSSTDSWTPTSSANAPAGRYAHTAVWTGTEMIVWGGGTGGGYFDSGGRYNPSTDSWTATSIVGAPSARYVHTAVWTGSEMIVWGGYGDTFLNTGGRYNPITDGWTPISATGAPTGRGFHTAVWTGSEMIVWGGYPNTNTGGRYNPGTDSWTATSTPGAPSSRQRHRAIWTGSEMIVWGGEYNGGYMNTGGRYNPDTDSWMATSTTNAPAGRYGHTAVWTGSEMIVWGGYPNYTGGRYNPGMDSWIATSTTGAPSLRYVHTAVWTGSEMIVWGGTNDISRWNTGGRYCAQSGSPTPTATPTATATPSATPRPTPTRRAEPTPRLRPTPAPRP